MRTTWHPLLVAAMLSLPAAGWPATHEVAIEGMKFVPAQLTVKQGDTVVWVNKDLVPHTATAKGVFDSRTIDAGKRWSWKATSKGQHGYVCVYHPGMAGQLVVQ